MNEVKTYEDGMRDAWNLARKLTVDREHGGLPCRAFEEMFGKGWSFDRVFSKGVYEVERAIKKWETDQKPVKGDIVLYIPSDEYALVTHVEDDEDCYYRSYHILYTDGCTDVTSVDELVRTGVCMKVDDILRYLERSAEEALQKRDEWEK